VTVVDPLIPSPRAQRIAAGYLVLATVFWGCSFTWAKFVGDFANQRLGLPRNHPAGPIVIIGYRFILAAVAWFLLFPQARRGWTRVSIRRGLLLGVLMASGMVLQMLGLDRTTAPVSSFLTALTVLFVPVISMVRWLRSPTPIQWIGVALATVGIWMLTGASPTGFGVGEMLGLSCAIAFSFYLLAVNAIVPHDDPYRMTGAALLVTGLIAFGVSAALLARGGAMDWRLPIEFPVWPRLLLLAFLPTVASFGLLTFFQPKLDATQAALIYLCEPIFTAIYDYAETRHRMTGLAIAGAMLIILANVMVELLGRWRGRSRTDRVE
jgi:drug/metabolite transporter (DMT)-like permease